jgi:hypothetical protein
MGDNSIWWGCVPRGSGGCLITRRFGEAVKGSMHIQDWLWSELLRGRLAGEGVVVEQGGLLWESKSW